MHLCTYKYVLNDGLSATYCKFPRISNLCDHKVCFALFDSPFARNQSAPNGIGGSKAIKANQQVMLNKICSASIDAYAGSNVCARLYAACWERKHVIRVEFRCLRCLIMLFASKYVLPKLFNIRHE